MPDSLGPRAREPSPEARKVMGRFHCEERLGGDGSLETWRARVQGLAGFDRLFALKCLAPGALARRPQSAENLLRAARALASLDDARLAKVTDSGLAPGSAFVAIELVHGVTLRALREYVGGAGPGARPAGWDALVAHVGGEIAGALARAHAANPPLVHAALAPDSVMLTPQGGVKLIDLGLRAAVHTPAEIAASATRGAYAAPELARGGTPAPAVDLFALGAIIHDLATGRPRPNAPATGDARPLPPELRAIVEALMAEDPAARPAAAAMETALHEARVKIRASDVRAELGALVRMVLQLRASRTGADAPSDGGPPSEPPAAEPPVDAVFTEEPTAIVATSKDGSAGQVASLLRGLRDDPPPPEDDPLYDTTSRIRVREIVARETARLISAPLAEPASGTVMREERDAGSDSKSLTIEPARSAPATGAANATTTAGTNGSANAAAPSIADAPRPPLFPSASSASTDAAAKPFPPRAAIPPAAAGNKAELTKPAGERAPLFGSDAPTRVAPDPLRAAKPAPAAPAPTGRNGSGPVVAPSASGDALASLLGLTTAPPAPVRRTPPAPFGTAAAPPLSVPVPTAAPPPAAPPPMISARAPLPAPAAPEVSHTAPEALPAPHFYDVDTGHTSPEPVPAAVLAADDLSPPEPGADAHFYDVDTGHTSPEALPAVILPETTETEIEAPRQSAAGNGVPLNELGDLTTAEISASFDAAPMASAAPSENKDKGSGVPEGIAFAEFSVGLPMHAPTMTPPSWKPRVDTPGPSDLGMRPRTPGKPALPASRFPGRTVALALGAGGLALTIGGVLFFTHGTAKPVVSNTRASATAATTPLVEPLHRAPPAAAVPAPPAAPAAKEPAVPAAAPATPPTALDVTSNPPGAVVWLGGKARGETPLHVDVPTGAHELRLVRPDYRTRVIPIDATTPAKLETELEATVPPPSGDASLTVDCRSRNKLPVLVDGQEVGLLCPATKLGLRPGTHEVGVLDPATGEKQTRSVTLGKGEKKIRFPL